ncbi:S8 family peptidase [Paenisporosarcina cavernae]|uniref:SLH domain-containing protein n=1 Tax=Paenisporosarcina cavernae TaxID=2320858 RepID=A0A385YT96_9BACL|nr:S8 family serine peptidase [Paenisporosarcina cavernae]AYC28908.1 hypothetical protein D3873_03120 [Paenisporosarcina cavernae]
MKKIILFIPILFLSFFFFSPQTMNATITDKARVIVTFEDSISSRALQKAQADITMTSENEEIVAAEIPVSYIDDLRRDPSVQKVELDPIVKVNADFMEYGLTLTEIPQAWNENFFGNGVKVAIIDSGIASHEDLHIAGGVSFVDYTTSFSDDNGHGTHVAGIIAAQHNSIGVAGIAPNVDLFSVKSMNQDGESYLSDVIAGIDWSIEHQMDIINMSFGTQVDSFAFHTILQKAEAAGILLVGAAGNDGTGFGDTVDYPAKYEEVIAVSAVDQNSRHASFSSTGPALEIAAPGVGIASTYIGNQYARMSGTSMAAPYVAGYAALLKQAYPTKSTTELRKILTATSTDLGDIGRDILYGFGLLHASSLDVDSETTSPTQPVNEPTATDTVDNEKVVPPLLPEPTPDESPEPEKTPAKSPEFVDVPTNFWAHDAIQQLTELGIINGFPNGTFAPSNSIRRDHVAAMLYRLNPVESPSTEEVFKDVSSSYSFYKEIYAMKQQGVFSGNNGYFFPREKLTRAEMAKILVEVFDLTGSADAPFKDVSQNMWAKTYIDILYANNITKGSAGNFHPAAPVTRAEFAVFVTRALEK